MVLGKLEKVQLRKVWPSESSHFTPWLAKEENIKMLGDELEIDIEVTRLEEWVGGFKVDILAKDTANDNTIIIENQFGKTDHSHLGQTITYASGLKAKVIIWISEQFTEEHRAAIDWLNEITDESVGFFGIEIELYRIGNSEPAPMFNIVCKPNDWSKNVKQKSAEAELSGTRLLQQEYWVALKKFVENEKRSFRLQKPAAQHWTSIAVGKSGFHINAIANTRDKWLCVQLVVIGAESLERFKRLRDLYELDSKSNLSNGLEWLEKAGKEHHVNLVFKDQDPTLKANWQSQHKILYEWIEKFHQYFTDKVKEI